MTKKELRKLISDSFTTAMGFACILSFISIVLLGIIWIILDSNRREHSIFYLLFAPLILLILWFVGALIFNYAAMSKKKKEKEKNMEYINSVFKTKQVSIKPKQIKAYETLFEQLESTHTLRYFAVSIDEKILIFINIDNEDIIKIEEVDKTEFLEFYEII